MSSLTDIKRTEIGSETFTDVKNIEHTVVHSVLSSDTNETKIEIEEKVVDDLYNIFTFRPRSRNS